MSVTIPSIIERIGVEPATKEEIESEDPLESINLQTKDLLIQDSHHLDERIPNYTEKEPFPFDDSLRPDPGGTRNKLSPSTAATNVDSSTTTSALLTSSPSIATSTANNSFSDNMGVRIHQPIVIVIDWICFCWVVRRAGFGVFIRTLMQLARDHGYQRVVKIILVLEEGNTHLSPELAEDVFTYAIDKHTVQIGYLSQPKYSCHCSQQFTSKHELQEHERTHPTRQLLAPPTITRSDVKSKDCTIPYMLEREAKSLYEATTAIEEFRITSGLILLASSRPHIFDQHIYAWIKSEHRVLLIHGHGKIPHSLPSTTDQPLRRPPLKDLLKQTQAAISVLHNDPSVANSISRLIDILPSDQHFYDTQSFIRSICRFTALLNEDPSIPVWRDPCDVMSLEEVAAYMSLQDVDFSDKREYQDSVEHEKAMYQLMTQRIFDFQEVVHSRQLSIDSDIDQLSLKFSTHVLGCYCIWTAPIWFEHFEKNIPTDSLPAQSVCPYYNADEKCPQELLVGGKCKHAHLCQACAGEHTLKDCPVNLFTKNPLFVGVPLQSDWTSWFPGSSMALWYYERWTHLLQRQVKQFGGDRWKMSLKQQDTICHHINTPSGLVEYLPGPDGKYQLDPQTKQTKFPPCRAIILIDWQNIHVTIRFIEDFLKAIKSFVLNRPGLTENAIRVCYIFLDAAKQADAVKALREYEKKYPSFPLQIESIQANKKQMIDSEIQSKLRTVPQSMQLTPLTKDANGVLIAPKVIQQAELVCMVSGDMDFSREMTRLVMLGHRMLLINNSQARYGFRVNPLWEESVDFITLPELQSYKALLQQKRDEKRSAAKTALAQGVGIKVGTVRLDDNTKLEQRIEQISGLAMHKKEHALLIADSVSGQLFRLKLPELSREKDARGKLLPIPSNDLLRGSLTVLAGSNKKSLINANNRLLTGPASNVRFDDLREVVIHTRTNDIFLCDYYQKRIACLPASSSEILALRHRPSGTSGPIGLPHYLCMDSQHDRLWLTDVLMDKYRLGFYDLQSDRAHPNLHHRHHHPEHEFRRRHHEAYQFIEVPPRILETKPKGSVASPIKGRPSGKCIAADGLHLIYFDEAVGAFYELTIILQPAISFTSQIIDHPPLSKPDGIEAHAAQTVRVPSIQLDVDGSYLFTDTWTHTLKRLVYLPQVSTKEITTKAHWEIKIVAGTGVASDIDGPANEAKFNVPTYLALDSEHHSVFISDVGSNLLRALYVDESQLMASGISSTSVKSGSSRSSSTKSTSSSSSSDFVWKSSPCSSYESGTCHLQAEHHKCAFRHECSKCGGPHSAMDCLDLHTFIHQKPIPKETESPDMRIKWIQQLVDGVQLLHRQKYPHLSLSSHNLLLDREFNLTICDPTLSAGRRHLPKPFGSLPWTAPESIDTNNQLLSADIWSIGWIMIEILTGATPFQTLQSPELIKSTLQQFRMNPTNSALLQPFLPQLPNYPIQLKNLIDSCLQIDPAKRPTINTLADFRYESVKSGLATTFQGLANAVVSFAADHPLGNYPPSNNQDEIPVTQTTVTPVVPVTDLKTETMPDGWDPLKESEVAAVKEAAATGVAVPQMTGRVSNALSDRIKRMSLGGAILNPMANMPGGPLKPRSNTMTSGMLSGADLYGAESAGRNMFGQIKSPPSNVVTNEPFCDSSTAPTDSDIQADMNDASESSASRLPVVTNWREELARELVAAKMELEKKFAIDLDVKVQQLRSEFEEKQQQFEATIRTEKEIELNRMRQEMQAEFETKQQRYEEEIKQRYQLQLEEQTKQIKAESASVVIAALSAFGTIPIASPSTSLPPTPPIIHQATLSSLPSTTSTTGPSQAAAPLICSFWNKGDCKKGNACPFKHICHYADRHPDPVPKDAHRASACPYKGNSSLSDGGSGGSGNEMFICPVCPDKSFNSAAQFQQHEQGRPHLLRMHQRHQQPPPYPGNTNTTNPPSRDSPTKSTPTKIRPLHPILPLDGRYKMSLVMHSNDLQHLVLNDFFRLECQGQSCDTDWVRSVPELGPGGIRLTHELKDFLPISVVGVDQITLSITHVRCNGHHSSPLKLEIKGLIERLISSLRSKPSILFFEEFINIFVPIDDQPSALVRLTFKIDSR